MISEHSSLDIFRTTLHIGNYLIKNLTKRKPNGKNKHIRGKKVQCVLILFYKCITIKSLSFHILIFHRNLSNIVVGNTLVNKFVRLSLKGICWTLISPHLSRSYVENNFGEMCFVLSLLVYPP
jgi:hypothetical protein